ncbi:MAG: tetratricopeptide repeat protein [Ectothiorhodospiraceae bacterium]|nr:tetratricopeptide repeat protein [Ectothiorhodospiraceae bacterium]
MSRGKERRAAAAAERARALLEEGLAHHRAGRLEPARIAYEGVLARDPRHAEATGYLGILAHQSGDLAGAERHLRRAVALRPSEAANHDNLGALLEARGELEAALACYARAEGLEPGVADRAFNVAIVLERLGRADEAIASCRRASTLAPGDAEVLVKLGNLLRHAGRATEAEPAFRGALAVRPNAPGALNGLGIALTTLGRHPEAVRILRDAVAASPSDGRVQQNLGNALRAAGAHDDAMTAYRRAATLQPGAVEPLHSLGAAALEAGRPDLALAAWLDAVELAPRTHAVHRALEDLLRRAEPATYEPRLARFVERVLADDHGTAQHVARVAAATVVLRHRLEPADPPPADRLAAAVEALAADRLALALLARTVNEHATLEAWLVEIRGWLACPPSGDSALTDAHLALAVAIARQCHHNEHVWRLDERDAAFAGRLAERLGRLAAASAGAMTPSLEAAFVRAAMLTPPDRLDCAERLRAIDPEQWSPALRDLVRVTLHEPAEERARGAALPSLTEVDEARSGVVRDQYEESPYPRWLDPPMVADEDYRAWLGARFPGAELPERLGGPVDVLVAGCGTGNEAIAIARARRTARILGVDLSRASLGYAARMAQRLGVDNLELAQADIMHLEALGRRFDVIESSGVLHHMDDPTAGWGVLARCLHPGGVVKTAFYSRRARDPVRRARALVSELGLPASIEGVRTLRARLLREGADGPLAELLASPDLWSASGCRDLLFHPREHEYDLGELCRMAVEIGLRPLGLEVADPSVRTAYRAFAPDDATGNDLDAWERFEVANPRAFTGMYVLWCQRV